ncbi:MAG: PilZ domain-containing protein [Campylobacterales bacterium]|nr:PilZ domain-containing protein [Campylobacterales bacterium]
MKTSHPLQSAEVRSFFESQKQGFLEACFSVLKQESTPELTDALLGFYEAIYLPILPSKEKLLQEISAMEASLVLARAWLYVINQAKYESWILELIETLSSSRFMIDARECCNLPLHVKSISFGEEAGFFIHNNIFDVFANIHNKHETITFLNLYEGVPIVSEATIVEVGDEEVVFKIDPLQELAMKHDNKAYIVQNQFFSKPVKADIVFCNMVQHEVTLTNFVYLLNMPATQRESSRVHPNTVAKVTLVDAKNNQAIEGILFDLSLGGVGVVSKLNHTIQAHDSVEVGFELIMPSNQEKVAIVVKATVVNVFEYDGAYRYCMKLQTDSTSKGHITRFVKEREKEVIETLKRELQEYM